MKYRIYTEDRQPVSNWSGGKTRELAIFPEGSSYLDRDFLWRLSTASSDREESSFSRLEGYDRILMVLEGDVVLAHGQERSVHLREMEQDTFDGGIKTKCFGRLGRDYNLIMARGCEGSLEVVDLTGDAKAMDPGSDGVGAMDVTGDVDGTDPDESGSGNENCEIYRSYGVFCLDGYAVVSWGEKSEMIGPGSQAVIDLVPGEDHIPKIMGEGRCVLARVAFEIGAPEKGSTEEGASERTGAEGGAPKTANSTGGTSFGSEYGLCLRLFARSNRWSRMMRRQGADKVYYDKALSRALERIEKKYITFIVWLIGCLLSLMPPLLQGQVGLGAAFACAFTALHIFLIAPLIYWKLLPRPVSAHIKSVHELNPFEKMEHEKEIARDPHFEKLMNKYNSDEENYFTDESSPLYRLMKKK